MSRRKRSNRGFRRLRFLIILICLVGAGILSWKFLDSQWLIAANPFENNPVGQNGNQEPDSPPSESEPEGESGLEPENQYPDDIAAFVQLPYFIDENLDRYTAYHEQYPDYSYETVMTYVNIGLDRPYYTEIETVAAPLDVKVLVNKYKALPADYVPGDLEKISGTEYLLRRDARIAFEDMREAAKAMNFTLYPVSAYRSYDYQVTLYNRYVSNNGQEAADQFSARAGHSEHQTGLAVDIQATNASVANTPEYAWYSEHAHEFGFIIRYPEGKDGITGYTYEPWHLRYLGVELATAVYESGLTYDEYYVRFIETDALLAEN